MSTLTSFLKLIKPTRLEKYGVGILNTNSDLIDKGIKDLDARTPVFTAGGNANESLPAGKTQKIFYGWVNVTTGAGGEVRTTANATDGAGVGGIWFGYLGVPTFEKVQYVNLDHGGFLEAFAASWHVISVDDKRIKFKGRRLDNTGWANGYGSNSFYVQIVGW